MIQESWRRRLGGRQQLAGVELQEQAEAVDTEGLQIWNRDILKRGWFAAQVAHREVCVHHTGAVTSQRSPRLPFPCGAGQEMPPGRDNCQRERLLSLDTSST